MSKESAKEYAKARKAQTTEVVTLKKDYGKDKKGDKISVHKSIAKILKKREIV